MRPPRLDAIKHPVGDLYRRWRTHRNVPELPSEAIVPLERTDDVLLLCSRFVPRFDPQPYIRELAFAHEMATNGREFAVADDPSQVFDKSVGWIVPGRLVSPPLWDYSRQVYEFAAGLERQGNRLFCSSDETLYWENKAYMHARFAETGVPTPQTRLLTEETWQSSDFDIEPVLLKEEHSAGSSGIHFFERAPAAQKFVKKYAFRPGETLIMQEVVPGATKDMRVTMVGATMIPEASYWRIRSNDAVSSAEWTTTATTYNSIVDHDDIPEAVEELAAGWLRKLGIRTAGIDLMWVNDDISQVPLVLELSPYYQPNPPKPERYGDWSYKQYKAKPYVRDGYIRRQYVVFRKIIKEALKQELY